MKPFQLPLPAFLDQLFCVPVIAAPIADRNFGNFRFVTACIPEILHYVFFRLHVSPLFQMLHEEALQLVKRYRTLSAASVMP